MYLFVTENLLVKISTMKKLSILLCMPFLCSSLGAEASSGQNETSSLCGPIPAVCYPQTLMGGMGMGISFVSFNQINNPSGTPAQLEDFTCSDSTWLDPGSTYNFTVHTGMTYEETVTAWIDFNNDGNFDLSERIFKDSAVVYIHAGMITIPTGVLTTFTPIRLRIGSDYSGNPPLNGCNDATYGQYEDYTIYFGTGTGMKNDGQEVDITISPNPFHDSATLRFATESFLKNQVLELSLYNMLGECIRRQPIIGILPAEITRNDLPDGIYHYELSTLNRTRITTGKIVLD